MCSKISSRTRARSRTLLSPMYGATRITGSGCIGAGSSAPPSAAPRCCARLLRRANYPRQFGGGVYSQLAVRSTPASMAGPPFVTPTPLRGGGFPLFFWGLGVKMVGVGPLFYSGGEVGFVFLFLFLCLV